MDQSAELIMNRDGDKNKDIESKKRPRSDSIKSDQDTCYRNPRININNNSRVHVRPIETETRTGTGTGSNEILREAKDTEMKMASKFESNIKIRGLKLEAMFHPKFENEGQTPQQEQSHQSKLVSSTHTPSTKKSKPQSNSHSSSHKRQQMIDKVSSGEGYLEASLKHSGSLLLWSGGQRFYSKNSTDNVFTHVGELLLLQHFARAWSESADHNDTNTDNSSTCTDDDKNANVWIKKYRECSEYVQSHRLTLSFEVVTSILGHHGAIPHRDYLILLAVADQSAISSNQSSSSDAFYATGDLTELAQRFRLPHNDAWMFINQESALELFDVYDGLRENGLARDVVDALTDASASEGVDGTNLGTHLHVKSMYPHEVFQGEILEGIVIRYVPYSCQQNIHYNDTGTNENENENAGVGVIRMLEDAKQKEMEKIQQLCYASETILKLVPPNKEVPKVEECAESETYNVVLGANLREMAAMSDFESSLKEVLATFHGKHQRCLDRTTQEGMDMVHIAKEILSISEHARIDEETRQIAQLISTLDALNINVTYKIVAETIATSDKEEEHPYPSSNGNNKIRYLCIIHVHNDNSFQKYHKAIRESSDVRVMKLYRGFSIQLLTEEQVAVKEGIQVLGSGVHHGYRQVHINSRSGKHVSEETLMLKNKFLPYMVRTFICRNGLAILSRSGIHAYEHFAMNLLMKWNISQASINKWMPFFKSWAKYCNSVQNGTNVLVNTTDKGGEGNVPGDLRPGTYLHHYNKFSGLFEKGEFQFDSDEKTSDFQSFRGLVFLVGPKKELLSNLGKAISDELGCSKVVHDVNKVSENDMLFSIQRNGGGVICTANIFDGSKVVRALAKNYEDSLYIILVGCSEDELEEAFVNLDLDADKAAHQQMRKMKGITMSWRKTKCKLLLDLPVDAIQSGFEETVSFLRTDGTATSLTGKLKDASMQSFQVDDRPGLIVFFPMIPGSGKSSLCQDITENSLGIENDRKLILREGDKVKGKFYKQIEKTILEAPACIAILDKNVPPASWFSISDLGAKSRSVLAAVLLKDMEDTTISNALSSHVYPFSLQFLAVCMSRVLDRKPNSHNGKLDAAADLACMIVVKFFCLYRDTTNEQMKDRFATMGTSCGVEFSVPFFKQGIVPALPDDLKLVLEDAVNLRTREDLKQGEVSNELMTDMEARLRSQIAKFKNLLDTCSESLDESKEIFRNNLTKAVAMLGEELGEEERQRPIKIASLDFDFRAIYSAVDEVKRVSPELEKYFASREKYKTNNQNDKELSRFITSLHVTFAHASNASQAEMYAQYAHLIGVSAEVSLTAILFSDKAACIEVKVPNLALNDKQSPIPQPLNNNPHITLWCAEGTSAYEANMLPKQVQSQEAQRVAFKDPVKMKGVFNFWYL